MVSSVDDTMMSVCQDGKRAVPSGDAHGNFVIC